MSYLIDTHVWSELRNRGRADAHVRRWAEAVHPAELYLSVVTVFELERGVLLIERRDPEQGARLRGWLERNVLAPFAAQIQAIDATIARRCAALIAATALVHGLTVVTRNPVDFAPMGVALLNPWVANGTLPP